MLADAGDADMMNCCVHRVSDVNFEAVEGRSARAVPLAVGFGTDPVLSSR